jgi:hypothetical protein
VTQAFDDIARGRDALYQAGAPWRFDHPLEVAISCERHSMRDRRTAAKFLVDAQWWLDKRDAALAKAQRQEVTPGDN